MSAAVLTAWTDTLQACGSDSVRIWDPSEGLVATHAVDRSEPLVDVALANGDVYLLTDARLLRTDRW